MKTNKNHSVLLFSIFLLCCGWGNAQNKKWIAPAAAINVANPIKDKAKAAVEGKKTYNQICYICHGLQGKGNGEGGMTLVPKPANFLLADIENETDGSLFWKMTEGRAPMAAYKDALSETQRWQLVCYIRELQKKGSAKK